MPMEMDHLTDRMGTETILPVKQSIPIDTMINFVNGPEIPFY